MTAEIFGRETGLGRGRGGHMHLFDPATHFSCSGIIAEGYPPALGQAFAFRQRGTDRVAVAVTGEGAANQGAFHESLNLAALWKLPVVFVVEDNDWGISVPRAASTSVASNAVRGAAYDMPAERIEDNAVEAVYDAAGRAVARARAGDGPTLLEVHTLRLWGHFEGDAQGYRPDLEDVPGPRPHPDVRADAARGRRARRRPGRPGRAGGRWRASRRRSRSPSRARCPTLSDATAYVFA